MDPTTPALLGDFAADRGDDDDEEVQAIAAQRPSRSGTRRARQIAEITALVVAGDRERAAGLALEHLAEFPADAALLARATGEASSGRGPFTVRAAPPV